MLAKATFFTAVLAAAGACVQASPVEKRAACSSYTIIDTRGTGEPQGPSAGFVTMNQQIRSAVSGGSEYDTVYPAGFDQNSAQATQNILATIQNGVARNSGACFILEGYSQGAAATVNAMKQIQSGSSFNAVKAVILLGDPEHTPGLACNVDGNGGTSTKYASGLEAYMGGIPSVWVSKTIDFCALGDGVCDTASGFGITPQHLSYPYNSYVQNTGAQFAIKALQQG